MIIGMAREIPIFSLTRAKILSVLKLGEPMTIQKLTDGTGLGRTTIYHHLDLLKSHKLISEKQNKKEHGSPVYVTTNKANPISLKTLEMFEKVFPGQFKK